MEIFLLPALLYDAFKFAKKMCGKLRTFWQELDEEHDRMLANMTPEQRERYIMRMCNPYPYGMM